MNNRMSLMSNKKIVMTNTFIGVEPDGRRYQICEFTESHEVGGFNEPVTWIDGLKYYELDANGTKLNRLSETEFQVVTTGEILTKA